MTPNVLKFFTLISDGLGSVYGCISLAERGNDKLCFRQKPSDITRPFQCKIIP